MRQQRCNKRGPHLEGSGNGLAVAHIQGRPCGCQNQHQGDAGQQRRHSECDVARGGVQAVDGCVWGGGLQGEGARRVGAGECAALQGRHAAQLGGFRGRQGGRCLLASLHSPPGTDPTLQ